MSSNDRFSLPHEKSLFSPFKFILHSIVSFFLSSHLSSGEKNANSPPNSFLSKNILAFVQMTTFFSITSTVVSSVNNNCIYLSNVRSSFSSFFLTVTKKTSSNFPYNQCLDHAQFQHVNGFPEHYVMDVIKISVENI